jgi:hypothetical protein
MQTHHECGLLYNLILLQGLSNRDIADHLSKGERLNKPSDCPDDM